MTLLGASVVLFIKKPNKNFITLTLGVSGGIMIAASFFSLITPAINILNTLNRNTYVETSLGFLTGSFLIIICDIIMDKKLKIKKENKESILLVSAVSLHNFPEGLVVGVAFGSLAFNNDLLLIDAILIAFGIGIQNIPEGVSTSIPLRKAGYSKGKSFMLGQLSGVIEIIAGIIGALFVSITNNLLPFLLSFSAGAMISVTASELIPESFKENKILASIGLSIGFAVMMFLDLSLS